MLKKKKKSNFSGRSRDCEANSTGVEERNASGQNFGVQKGKSGDGWPTKKKLRKRTSRKSEQGDEPIQKKPLAKERTPSPSYKRKEKEQSRHCRHESQLATSKSKT